MELSYLHKQITRFDIAGLRDVDLAYENTYRFFGLGIKFKSNSLELLQELAQSFSCFSQGTKAVDVEFRFIEEGPLFCQMVFITPIVTHFIYRTDNGIVSIYQESSAQEIKIAYLGEKPKCKPPLDQVKVIDSDLNRGQLFFILDFLITIAIANLSKQHLLFHAASLAWHGTGVILAGETMTGKTTLSLALARSGFDFLSDEVACLELATHRLIPFPKSMCVREQTLKSLIPTILGEQELCQDHIEGNKRWLIKAKDLGIGAVGEPCSSRYFFLLRDLKEQPQIEPVPVREALWYTLSSSYASIADPVQILFALGSLFDQLKCYHLWPGRVEDTVSLIHRTITQETTC